MASHISPVGDGNEKVTFPPDRPSFLPNIYIKRNHPHHKGSGCTFYYIQDGSPRGMQRVARLERNSLAVPEGGEREAIRKGFLKLVPGDAVYVRLTTSPSSGLEDVPVCWVNGRELFPESLQSRAYEVRDTILGPRSLRSRVMPTGKGVHRQGGTKFERDFPPNDNVRGGRCYPYGTSFEGIPKLYAPCAQGRRDRSSEAAISYRSELLEVTLDMATRNILAGPDEVAEGMRLNHDLLNTPSVGVTANAFFGANQLNLAPAERIESTGTLASALGSAGAAHIDPMDSPAHFTNMTCASDLPPGFDPGRFFLLYPGVFYEQGDFVSCCFSGLRRHGGTPPIAPQEASPEELQWATHVTLVSYPPTGAVSSSQRRVLCGDGIGGSFHIASEMIIPEHLSSDIPPANHATFTSEGPKIMPRSSLMDFVCRSLLQLVIFVLRQLPVDYNARVDSDAFMACFSYDDDSGERQGVGSWECAPGWKKDTSDGRSDSRTRSTPEDPDLREPPASPDVLVSQQGLVSSKHARWLAFFDRFAGHIPYAVAVKEDVRPLEGWTPDPDSNDRPPKLSTVKLPNGDEGSRPITGNKANTTPDWSGKTPPPPKRTSRSDRGGSISVYETHSSPDLYLEKWFEDQIPPSGQNAYLRDVNDIHLRYAQWLDDDNAEQEPNHVEPEPERETVCEPNGGHVNSTEDEPIHVDCEPEHEPITECDGGQRVEREPEPEPEPEPVVECDGSQRVEPESEREAFRESVIECDDRSRVSGIEEERIHLEHEPNREPVIEWDGVHVSDTEDARRSSPVEEPDAENDSASDAGNKSNLIEPMDVEIDNTAFFSSWSDDNLLWPELLIGNGSVKAASGESSVAPNQTPLMNCADDFGTSAADCVVNNVVEDQSGVLFDALLPPATFTLDGLGTAVPDGTPLSDFVTDTVDALQNFAQVGDPSIRAETVLFPDSDMFTGSWPDAEDSMDVASDILSDHGNAGTNELSSATTDQLLFDNLQTMGYASLSPRPDKSLNESWASDNHLPRFLKNITADVVYSELMAVQTAVVELSLVKRPYSKTDPDALLYRLNSAMTEQPVDPATLYTITQTRNGLDNLLAEELSGTLQLKQLRSCIMLGNYASWTWLESSIPLKTSEILTGASLSECSWLERLILDVRNGLSTRSCGARFSPGYYGLCIEGGKELLLDLGQYAYDPLQPDVGKCSTIKAVHNIIAEWLNYPFNGQSYWRAVFVDTLCITIGQDAMVLETVWQSYQTASKGMLAAFRNKILKRPVEAGDSVSPLFDPSSQLRSDLHKLAAGVHLFDPENGTSVSTDSGGNNNVTLLSLGSQIVNDRVAAFKNFLFASFNYVFRGLSTGNEKLDLAFNMEADHYIPFREKGPSRMHVMQEGGPFDGRHVRTVQGVFSAVVSRATTFDTRFSKEGRTLFCDANDFFLATREIGCTSEKEYCNPSAYGQPIAGRKAALVHKYWAAVNQEQWPGLKTNAPIPFIECLNYFHPPKGKSRFPQLGKLGAYLLTADYVYAGVVESPTVSVMSRMITSINKGALNALELLGLTASRTKNARGHKLRTRELDMNAIINDALSLVSSSVPDGCQSEAGIDYIVMEHALCKFARVTSPPNVIVHI